MAITSPLIQAEQSILVLIDIQAKLMSAMADNTVLNCSTILAKAAKSLNIPMIATAQYPQGLGEIEAELVTYLNETALAKTCFSCADLPAFMTQLKASKKQQIIITGVEAHICVLQTALSLQAQGFQVFVVVDAVSSRTQENKDNALQRLQQAGVIVTNTESVLFEWLADAKHPEFRALSKLIV